jgi:ketosteroid isomerase-like protein
MGGPGSLTDADRVQIGALITRYARCVDMSDVDGFVANFTSNATFATSGGRTANGDAEIRALFESIVHARQTSVRHFAGQPTIEGDTNDCRVQSYSLVLVDGADGPRIRNLVEYADHCVKVDEVWLFADRRNRAVLPSG